MEWILAVTLMSGEVLATNFNTEKECVRELHMTVKAMEQHNEKIDHASCTQGIVVSAIDEED